MQWWPGLAIRAAGGALVLALACGSAAAQIDAVQQPRGTPIAGLPGVPVITTGIDANSWVGTPPPTEPFDNTQPAGVVRTTEPVEYYVRLYAPPNSNAAGPWLMRAATVRGLTPEQLRDRFALPFLPTFITNVLVPSGTCLLTGIAGPIMGNFTTPSPPGPWGHGGAQQTRVVGVDTSSNCTSWAFVPASDFVNRRPIGANALWYAPVVGSGNPAAVAVYLDHLSAPAEYGDLFNAYNTLDLLNDGTASGLRRALREIAGESHAAALAIAVDASDRFARRLVDRARAMLAVPWTVAQPQVAMSALAAGQVADPGRPQSSSWFIGGGEFGRAGGNDDHAGYRFNAGTVGVGYDRRFSPDWLAGLAAAYEHTGFDVDGPPNSGTIDSARGAVYGAGRLAGFRLAGAGSASFDHYGVSRSMPSFARSASSTYDGWTLAFSGEASRPLSLGAATLEPFVGLSVVQAWRERFTEAGAGALSLAVASGDFTKVAGRIGAAVALPAALNDRAVLRPWLRAAWAHDFADAVSDVSASLAGATAPGSFVVQSADTGRDAAQLGAGVTLDLSPRASISLAYQGELRRDAEVHAISAVGTLRW